MTRTYRNAARLAALLLGAPAAFFAVPPEPAIAWRIVYDPTNYAQNVLQAARALEQINQQIAQLQNEAQMLINDARNLASLPTSSLEALQQSVAETQALLGEAQKIAYDVQAVDEAFATDYGAASTTASDQALIDSARDRWQTTVGGLQDAMRVQAGVVGNIEAGRAELEKLVGASQNATGALQATQAGNQLLALQSQQIMDLTALLAAQGRAAGLEAAAEAAAQEQAAEQRRRFLEPGTG
ncbi:MAG: P-type conjugative transfer protein TrbJ, partial [Aestuariivirga sp.]